jgi:hypothetical protein
VQFLFTCQKAAMPFMSPLILYRGHIQFQDKNSAYNWKCRISQVDLKEGFTELWEPPTLIQALASHSLGAILC